MEAYRITPPPPFLDESGFVTLAPLDGRVDDMGKFDFAW
jgi:hypothetical protein